MTDVESIVNSKTDIRKCTMLRAVVTRRERRLKKLLMWTWGSALVTPIAIFLAVVGAVHGLFAVVVSVVSLMFACYVFGQYVEARRAGTRRY